MTEGWSVEETFTRVFASGRIGDLRENAIQLRELVRAKRLVAITPDDFHPSAALGLLDDAICLQAELTIEQLAKVTILPPILAPDAPRRLDGLSLVEAFRQFVLDDPEVQLMGQRVIKQTPGDADIFKEGRVPGPIIAYEWDLSSTSDSLAYDFVRLFFLSSATDDPKPSPEVKAASAALVDRVQALKAILVKGDVIATGTFAATGYLTPINRLEWGRDGVSIHVRNGDLCEVQDNKPVAKWTGIYLDISEKARLRLDFQYEVEEEPPTRSIPAKTTIRVNTEQVPARSRTSPQRESIEEAIQALWQGGLPKGMPIGRRNQMINDWQKQNGKAVTHDRTIARYLKSFTL